MKPALLGLGLLLAGGCGLWGGGPDAHIADGVSLDHVVGDRVAWEDHP